LEEVAPPPPKIPRRPEGTGLPQKPEAVDELEIIEEEQPIRRQRQGTPEAITCTPELPYRQTATGPEFIPEMEEIAEADEQTEEQPDRAGSNPRKSSAKKKRRDETERLPMVGLVVALIVGAIAWLGLTPLAIVWAPAAYVVLFIGVVVAFVGRRWLSRFAREEGRHEYVLMIVVPFYPVYFFFRRMRKSLVPFTIWACGMTFFVSGGITTGLHRMRDEASQPKTLWEAMQAPLDRKSLAETEAEVKVLLAEKKQEAREWLSEQRNPSSEVRSLIQGAYLSGAMEVIVVGLDHENARERQLLIVLPPEYDERKEFFNWYRQTDPEAWDAGQKFLLIPLP
jgi:hypothetical protein